VIRRVLALRFDDSGTLVDEKLLSKADGQQIAMAPGETQVIAKQPTVVQQLIGNVGRFNDQGDGNNNKKGGTPGAPSP
jgi:hypothetical protein